MAFGWVKKIFGVKKETETPKSVVLDYRGRTGKDDSPFPQYGRAMERAEKKGYGSVSISYDDNREMEKRAGASYLENIVQVEENGGKVMSVDRMTGTVRRLKVASKDMGLAPKEVVAGKDARYKIFETDERDSRGYKVTYVVAENSSAEVVDKGYRLTNYFNKIVRGDESAPHAIGRDYFERKLRELKAVSNSTVREFDGRKYYVNRDVKTKNVIKYSKNDVDKLIEITQLYLGKNFGWADEDRAIKLLTKKQLREALSKNKERAEEREYAGAVEDR